MKNSTRLSLVFAAVAGVVVASCANGSAVETFEGAGGAGGASGSGGSSFDGPATSSGNGNSATSGASSGSGATSSGATASSSAASSAVSSSASGLMCNPPQHLCSGQCLGNTPDTGCTTSVSCLPCPAPANGTASCTPNGTCDFSCAPPYIKNGNLCSCGAQCCTNADCPPNNTCTNNMCVAPPPSCDQQACTAGCVISCLPKFGIGICFNNMCLCQCN